MEIHTRTFGPERIFLLKWFEIEYDGDV